MVFNAYVKSKIRQLLINYHRQLNSPKLSNERDFIKCTTSFFQNCSISHGRLSFKTRSANIDRSPLVQFYPNKPWMNPCTREIGDLLFISKFIRGHQIVRKRAAIVQSKFTGTGQRSWKGIDTAQFYFILRWPYFIRINPKPQIAYSLFPSCLTWGSYVFVGPQAVNYPLYYTSSRIFREHPQILSQKTFTFHFKKLIGWDTSPSFLMRQILCLIGEDLFTNSSIDSFVDDLYGIVGLRPDPPGEFEWESSIEERPKGFGVVEFIMSSPEIE